MTLRNNSFSYRIEDDVRRAVQVKFLHKIGTMGFNGLRPEVQQAGNILVRLAFGQQLQHFFFTFRKEVIRVAGMLMLKLPHKVRQQHFADRRTKKMTLLADRLQGKGQIAFNRLLEDVPFHSGIQSSDDIVFVGVHAQQDDSGFRMSFQNLRRSIDPVQKRHSDVQDDNVGGQLFCKFNGLMAVRRLSDDLCLIDSFEQERQASPHYVMIVRDDDSRLAHLAATVGKWNFYSQERSAAGPGVDRQGSSKLFHPLFNADKAQAHP